MSSSAGDGLRALRSAVVRLKSYGRGEDTHVCKNKRPHLLVLTPDALQLFTSDDAAEEAAAGGGKPAAGARAYGGLGKLVSVRARGESPMGREATGAAAPAAAVAGAAAPTGGDAEDLQEGQVFRLGVALGQILSVQVVKDCRLLVTYTPNRPSKRNAVEEHALSVLRSLRERMEEAVRWREAAGEGARRRDPTAHHFTVVAADGGEARGLAAAVQRAQRQLALAVEWLADGLPLRPQAQLVMLTVTGGGEDGGAEGGAQGRGRAGPPPGDEAQGAGAPPGHAFVLPFPAWGAQLELPPAVGAAIAAPSSRRAAETSIAVYLSTPLGPAVAALPLAQLRRSAAEGSCPLTAVAALQTPPGDDASRPGKRWEVVLHWHAVRGEPLPQAEQEAAPPPDGDGNGDAPRGRAPRRSPSPDRARRSPGGRPARRPPLAGEAPLAPRPPTAEVLVAAAAVSLLAGCLLAYAPPAGPACVANGPLASLSAAQAGAAALLAVAAASGVAGALRTLRRRLAAAYAAPPRPAPAAPAAGPAAPADHLPRRWRLVLLDADLEEELQREEPASPAVKRTVSVSRPPSGLGLGVGLGVASPVPGGPLPRHIELLVEANPGVVTRDTARRFVVGLESETKAFTALTAMLAWTRDNGLEGVASRPQPAFAAMKRCYAHGFPGWSRRRDCLVEVECMGRWPGAHAALTAEGVSEQAMLEHLLFTYQYAFTRLDARPLPHGKTVKIVDLEGLGMGDLRSPGFALITRVRAAHGAALHAPPAAGLAPKLPPMLRLPLVLPRAAWSCAWGGRKTKVGR
jgi:hypothetical protein